MTILRTRQPEPSRAAWDAWDAAMKRRLGWWSALKAGGVDAAGNRVLFRWHWDHRMYASWRVYPAAPVQGFMRQLGFHRSHGCMSVSWWFSGCIVAKSAPGARDIPAAFWELKAPAIHVASGEYGGGGRNGATAREWPDHPPSGNPYLSYASFLRDLFG